MNAVTGNWANVEADSSISQNWGFSTGAWENANVYRDGSNTTRGLLRLSLSEAAASDGKLRLYDVLDPVGNPDMTGETFDVYLMSAANDDWSEAEGKWSEKASGVPWDGGSHESGMSLISTYTFSGSSLPETIEVDIAQAVINDVVANRGGDMSLLLVGWDDPGDGTHGFQFNTKENTANPASARLMYNTPEPATPKNRGDVTKDGFVGADDLVRILTYWGASGPSVTWDMGDCAPYNDGINTGDHFIGSDDYVEVLTFWGASYPTEPIPEPATLGLLLLGGLVLLRRRK